MPIALAPGAYKLVSGTLATSFTQPIAGEAVEVSRTSDPTPAPPS